MDQRIERLQRVAAGSPDVLSLAGGLPANELFPRRELSDAVAQAMADPRSSALQYGWPEGDHDLRDWIAERLRSRGADVRASDVIVTSGAQQALAITSGLLLGPGKTVQLDPETYPAALDLFRAEGAHVTTGLGATDCVYVMPGVGNPRGLGITDAASRELLESGAAIIADEAYADLRFDGQSTRPLLADARDRTWHIGTLSKVICPGLRIGWLIPPPSRRKDALELKRSRDLQTAGLTQVSVRTFLARDDFYNRLERARSFYECRAEYFIRALRRRLPSWRFRQPEGGFSVFVETDFAGDDANFLACGARNGIAFDPGALFQTNPTSNVTLRLSYSNLPAASLAEAVARLERAALAFVRAHRPSRYECAPRTVDAA